MSDHWTVNVCRLIFLFLLLFFMCQFVVVAVTKLDSKNNNNNKHNSNNKKITLHSSTDQFNSRTHIYWITVLILLHCNVLLTLEVHTILGNQMPLQGVHLTVHCLLNCIPQHVKMTLCSTALDLQMPLPGGYTSDCPLPSQLHSSFLNMSRWPYVVLLLATRCLYWGYMWPGYVWLQMSSWPYIWL